MVALRVLYRLWDVQPREVPAPAWQQRLARAVHVLLYAAMIVMPITGYLGTGTEFFGLFVIPKFPETWLFAALVQGWLGLTFEEFEKPLDLIHHTAGAYVVWVLIAVHVAGALQHHMIRKDETLLRMLPRRMAGPRIGASRGTLAGTDS